MDPLYVWCTFSSIHWGTSPQPWIIQVIVMALHPWIGCSFLGECEQSLFIHVCYQQQTKKNDSTHLWWWSQVCYLFTYSSLHEILHIGTCVVPNTCTTENPYFNMGNNITAPTQMESPFTHQVLYHLARLQSTKAELHPKGKNRLSSQGRVWRPSSYFYKGLSVGLILGGSCVVHHSWPN